MSKGALKILLLFVVIAAIVIAIILVKKAEAPTQPVDTASKASTLTQEKNMKITSSAFGDNENIPGKFTCDGENINPPLEISGVPEGAKSLVLIVDDPDAPAGTWVHWTVWNIAPDTEEIPEGSVPAGAAEGETSFGKSGYGGPCPPRVDEQQRVEVGPPSGTHHYQFKLYALDTVLTLESSAAKKDIEQEMERHILEQTILIGLYSRK